MYVCAYIYIYIYIFIFIFIYTWSKFSNFLFVNEVTARSDILATGGNHHFEAVAILATIIWYAPETLGMAGVAISDTAIEVK